MKDGQILKKAIKLSDYDVSEVLEKTGISRGTLYNLYKADIIDDVYKEVLKPLELNLEFNTKNQNNTNQTTEDMRKENEELRKQVEKWRSKSEQQADEIIEMQKKIMESLPELGRKPFRKAN